MRIHEPPAQSGILQVHSAAEGAISFAKHKWRASHTLDASSYKGITSPSLYRLSRAIDSLQARTTESIHRLTGNLDRQPSKQQGHTRYVTVILASLVSTTQDNIFNITYINICSPYRFSNRQ